MQAESGTPFTHPPHALILKGPSERGEHEQFKDVLPTGPSCERVGREYYRGHSQAGP